MALHGSVLFLTAFLATIAFVRLFVRYAPERTLTGYVRHKTLLYVHHVYVGIAVLAVGIPLVLAFGFTPPLTILVSVGLALSLDELSAWVLFIAYPSAREASMTLALVVAFVLYVLVLSV